MANNYYVLNVANGIIIYWKPETEDQHTSYCNFLGGHCLCAECMYMQILLYNLSDVLVLELFFF